MVASTHGIEWGDYILSVLVMIESYDSAKTEFPGQYTKGVASARLLLDTANQQGPSLHQRHDGDRLPDQAYSTQQFVRSYTYHRSSSLLLGNHWNSSSCVLIKQLLPSVCSQMRNFAFTSERALEASWLEESTGIYLIAPQEHMPVQPGTVLLNQLRQHIWFFFLYHLCTRSSQRCTGYAQLVIIITWACSAEVNEHPWLYPFSVTSSS